MTQAPDAFTTINSVSVETANGYKTFNLVHGDVTAIPTDLLVVSTHGEPRMLPTGLVLDTLHEKYGISIDPDCHWLSFAEGRWTCFQKQKTKAPFRAILTVRIPQIMWQQDPPAFFDEAVRGVFASLASLEYMGQLFPIVSLPVLYGQRLCPEHRPGAVESLIRHGLHWLKKSGHTHTIQFVVYNGHELQEWDQAMNTCMGRSLIAAGTDGVINSLCQEIRQQATAQTDTRLQGTLEPLAFALAHSDRLYVQSICVFGRKLVEEMLQVLMPLWGLKIQKELMNNIDTLEKAKCVAPWITSYMHSLRVFGNETIHARGETPGYRPHRMEKGDLVSALCAIRALLASWPEMTQEKSTGLANNAGKGAGGENG